jgi:hypothetical protein
MTVNEIVPGLYVGSKPPSGRYAGIDTIVLAAVEYQPPAALFPDTRVVHVPLNDDPKRPPDEVNDPGLGSFARFSLLSLNFIRIFVQAVRIIVQP